MKLLVTGVFQISDFEIDILKNMGIEIFFHKYEKDIVEKPHIYDGIVCNGLFLWNDIKKFSNLKFIQLTSAGMDRIDIEYIKSHNIKIYNADYTYSVPMAEMIILGILQIYKKSFNFFKSAEKHLWEKQRNLMELYGKKALIIGTGNVGRETSKRLTAFGVDVIGVNTTGHPAKGFEKCVSINDFKNFIPQSDIIITLIPLKSDTKGIIDKECFDIMNNNTVFVNMARGGIIDEYELKCVLKERKILGAVLDVFYDEPLSIDSEFWDFDNVIITPHNSFVGEGNHKRLFDIFLKNIKNFLNLKNPDYNL